METARRSDVVVFLGPTLPASRALEILDAQYLPPAGFGDVYRLIGGDVRTVVLVDGVFHGRAPVWHREILDAMESGIRVYGAASMGALRAAELCAYGMIGVGTAYRWYASGAIDGDDEVALLYAGAEHGYRPLSEPLVNVRFRLEEAVSAGILEPGEAASLSAAMKSMPFWQRTREALSEAARAIDEPRRARLDALLLDPALDLKRRDAIEALESAALHLGAPDSVAGARAAHAAPMAGPLYARSYHDHQRLMKRAFPRARGERLEGRALVDRLLSSPGRRRALSWSLGARFFALAWARERGVVVPADEITALEAVIHARAAIPSRTTWLRANGLTEAEQRDLLARHLVWTWLLTQPPERFGIPSLPAPGDEGPWPPEPDIEALRPLCDRSGLLCALPYVAAWCRLAGAAPGPKAAQALTDRWRDALRAVDASLREPLFQAIWALEKGPVHFGYTTWSLSAELLAALQITGSVAALAASWEESAA
ncbi:TfuA-like protein [Sorangium sp. So ce381]|uniref:TfuA-like protein n=1 Tax=Sorangium sp. So ce381 TaxID=3133307 RepID=UPI003F5BA935